MHRLVLVALAAFAVVASRANAAVTEPTQPKTGPGGSGYVSKSVRVAFGGSGPDAWFVFEPVKPRPRRAPVAVITHGYFEYAGYRSLRALIWHTVRKGNVVVYPRWQTGLVTPCPGPLNIEPCVASATAGIKGGLNYLRADKSRVQPDVSRASYFGFSFGGILTANLANRYRTLGLPRPRAIFLDDPHDGGLNGAFNEPGLDDSLAGIPASVKLECHSGADGVISEKGKASSSCNALFPKLGHIPARNKDLLLTRTDRHGKPTLSSKHGVCADGPDPGPGAPSNGGPNAYDWNFCWRTWDALRSCAYAKKDCKYAVGNARARRSLGRWSDGRPVKPLKISKQAPIRP